MDRRRLLALLASGATLPLGRSEAATGSRAVTRLGAASPVAGLATRTGTDPWLETWELASDPHALSTALSSLPGPLLWQAVTRVFHECQYVAPAFSGLNTSYAYALSILSYVQGLVSAPHYGYFNTIGGSPPGSDPEDILAKQAGICGHAQILFMAIAAWLGVHTRPVYIWYPEEFPEYTGPGVPGHAAVEVYYGGTWHYFDPTWGWFFRNTPGRFDKIYSLVDVLQLPATTRQSASVENRSLLWTQVTLYRGPVATKATGYWFMDFQHLRVESPFGNVIYSR